jgi:hypothetical protein
MSDAWLDKHQDPTAWAAPIPRPKPIELDDLIVRL